MKINTNQFNVDKMKKGESPPFGPTFSATGTRDEAIHPLSYSVSEKIGDKLNRGVATHNQAEETEVEKGTLARIKSDKSVFVGYLIIIAMIVVMLLFTSCTQNIGFLNSSIVPAAQGSVVIKTDNNNNYVIQIHISDLAEAGRLQPPK